MRKAMLCALMMSLLILPLGSCAVGADTDTQMEQIQEEFSSAGVIAFTADVTADYGQRIFEYRLSFESSPDGGVITIIGPESIAGASVEITGNETTLNFDGAQVYTGEILPGGLSPVDAVPMMVGAWKSGLITESVREKYGDDECIAALFRITDDVEMRTWFTRESALPLHTEVYFDGYTVLLCDFYNVILSSE